MVDHVSHFVPDLGTAARALEALGFAVTPESAQQTQDGPAGTSNVCVMLAHGYLEFLAPRFQMEIEANGQFPPPKTTLAARSLGHFQG